MEKLTLQLIISKDLQTVISTRNTEQTSILKLIVGELQRSQNKILTNNEVEAILKKLVKSEKENLERQHLTTSTYLETLTKYMPEGATEAEIKEWITNNISPDLLEGPKKFTAIKQVLAYFGNRTDGQIVKAILSK